MEEDKVLFLDYFVFVFWVDVSENIEVLVFVIGDWFFVYDVGGV